MMVSTLTSIFSKSYGKLRHFSEAFDWWGG